MDVIRRLFSFLLCRILSFTILKQVGLVIESKVTTKTSCIGKLQQARASPALEDALVNEEKRR